MTSLATEFPIRPIRSNADFIAQVVSWLKGTEYSRIFDDPRERELMREETLLRTSDGEELRIRQIDENGHLQAIGFRHDFPDSEGRLWRTEVVLRHNINNEQHDLVRLRTECLAREHGVRVEFPRKPYLIKSMLMDGWGGTDGTLPVVDRPVHLKDEPEDLCVAQSIVRGDASEYLPIIYVTAAADGKWMISEDQANKLAFDLGGIAHVVLEPDRAFSFRLRELTGGTNPYGETLAISLPGRGIVSRYYIGLRYTNMENLLAAVREDALVVRSQMPAMGWDWTELQERALHLQRERDRNRLGAEEIEKLYQEELSNLQDRIRQLEAQLTSQSARNFEISDGGNIFSSLEREIGPELYPGEFTDRLRLSAKECSARSDQIGLDRRSKFLFDAFVSKIRASSALKELLEGLDRATRDPKHAAADLVSLLSRHGYIEKSDNKHIRMEALPAFNGLDNITIPKTPSEYRGMKNLCKQISSILGLSKLR